jgi:hypothetical protein
MYGKYSIPEYWKSLTNTPTTRGIFISPIWGIFGEKPIMDFQKPVVEVNKRNRE